MKTHITSDANRPGTCFASRPVVDESASQPQTMSWRLELFLHNYVKLDPDPDGVFGRIGAECSSRGHCV